jgi:nitrogen regulatory protein PII
MFCIHAIFNRTHLKNILEDLVENSLPGVTILPALPKSVFQVQEKEHTSMDMYEKIKIEIVVEESKRDIVLEIIRSECSDLGYGAGKLWITKIEYVERIRTGETNTNALVINKNKTSTVSVKNKSEAYYNSEDTPAS